ncbi:hypothetical protein C7212DRAFT_345468 [Tuber magnatum]|uniref:Uncharacterized protein n=1 Tax=Tuber magnatum TaxID=42249 RepID=A0A317SNI1_9PEZI|nr:hypothetical protein C7212DRAFT_345468 [Tuber magnatum]
MSLSKVEEGIRGQIVVHEREDPINGKVKKGGVPNRLKPHHSLFMKYLQLQPEECQVEVADNRMVFAEEVGMIMLKLVVFRVRITATVKTVPHVSSLGRTLISHAQLGKMGIFVEHVKDYGLYMRESGPNARIVGLAPEVDHLYPLVYSV